MAKRKKALKDKVLSRNPKYEHLHFPALSASQAAAATAKLRHDAEERMDSDARKGCTPSLCNASSLAVNQQQQRNASCSRACLDWHDNHAQDPQGNEMGEPLPLNHTVVVIVRGEEFRSFGKVSRT